MAYNHGMKTIDTEVEPLVTQRLNELIETKHISKADMARIAGVSRASVNGWFKRGSIGKDSAVKLAAYTGASVAWILGDDAGGTSELTQDEKRLLDLYRKFPDIERANMIAAFEMRLNELNEFYAKYVLKNK